MAARVFISHSAADRPQIDPILRRLESRGVSIWIAPDHVRPGIDYPAQTHQAIEDCTAFVVVVSEKANSSRYVQAETELAFKSGKEIFPIRLDNTRPGAGLGLFLNMAHWTDGFGAKRNAQLDRLSDELLVLGDPAHPIPPLVPPRLGKTFRIKWVFGIAIAIVAVITIVIISSRAKPADSTNGLTFSDPAGGQNAHSGQQPASPPSERGSPEELKQAIQGRWDLVSDTQYQCSPPDIRITLDEVDRRTIRYTYPDPRSMPMPSCILDAGGDQLSAVEAIPCSAVNTSPNFQNPSIFYRLSPDRQVLYVQEGISDTQAPPETTYRRCP